MSKHNVSTVDPKKASRRKFLKGMAAGAAAAALPVKALAQGSSGFMTYGSWEEYFQKNFQEMTPEEVKATLKRLEEKYTKQYGKKVTVKATPPMENVLFGYALDLSRCIGCRRCVYACVKENNQSRRDPQIHYIHVLRFENGEMEFEKSERYYNPERVPEEGHYYLPVQCQHCRKAPCIKACPVRATWAEDDGIVVVDYNWCIGCRYCMAACPYEGRMFNWLDPKLPPEELNPDTHYLGNRPRMRGVVEKCTFCIQRTREGRYPACLEACPVGARKFGNLLDPESEIRYILENHRVFRLKEDLLTEPKFYYFFG
ncbi:4Fe-4S dicluster domain-containing protein [Deferrisoma camini]|uniref:4Fe-4S dicluster domain-containing protein n=1 Tax=Deferrisoma camini TaxID=1035120 RepID=UPI00046D0FA3|nr:4Fe-4S dicluster domain-containing protein [Deferrisoma camini]